MDNGVRISETIKKEQPDYVGLFLFGDPPETRQGCALSICFANIRLYVPFADAKDGQWRSNLRNDKKEQPDCVGLFLFGDPPEIRTPDTLIKSLRVVFVRGVQGRIVESVAEIAPLYLAVK